jgi:hypothetical protein
VRYQAVIPAVNDPNDRPIARYVWEDDRLFVSNILEIGCRGRVDRAARAPVGVTAEGIDCFAETLRHEWHHRSEELLWWRSSAVGYTPALDPDLDLVPSSVESKEPGCSSTSARSCTARPFADVTDREINAYYVGWTWPIGGADGEDWSCGGKQWGGGGCPE